MFRITYSIVDDTSRMNFDKLVDSLPGPEKDNILKIKLKNVQLQKTIARIILANQLSAIGYPDDILSMIERNVHGKPYLPGNIWFNISHSHDLVAVCISDECDLGIDIEKIRVIDLAGFEMYFSGPEWGEIRASETPAIALLKSWTVKEAFLKAIGTGFLLGANDFQLNYSQNCIESKKMDVKYFFNYVDLHPDYIIAFCSVKKKPEITIERFIFS